MQIAVFAFKHKPQTFREFFYVCNVTFGRLRRSHLDAKLDGSVTANVMLCHVLITFYHFFHKTYQFRGVEACLRFQIIQKR